MTAEFVNREEAEAHAAKALDLMTRSKDLVEASFALSIEACFEWQAVANLVGPASNTGTRGITWAPTRSGYCYFLTAACVLDDVKTSIATAAATPLEAREDRFLMPAAEALDRAASRNGGLRAPRMRAQGTGAALGAVAGRADRKGIGALLGMVSIADRYGREGVFEQASLSAHTSLVGFPDRADLIRAYPAANAAAKKARILRGHVSREGTARRRQVPVAVRQQLMRRAGLSPEAAQSLLSLLLNDETTILALKRAVKSLPTLLTEIDDNRSEAA